MFLGYVEFVGLFKLAISNGLGMLVGFTGLVKPVGLVNPDRLVERTLSAGSGELSPLKEIGVLSPWLVSSNFSCRFSLSSKEGSLSRLSRDGVSATMRLLRAWTVELATALTVWSPDGRSKEILRKSTSRALFLLLLFSLSKSGELR